VLEPVLAYDAKVRTGGHVRSIQYGRLVVAVCGLLLMIATAAVIFGVHRIHELA